MFEKLLTYLPYKPQLQQQIGFYTRRMRHEESLRRTGLILLALAFIVQLVATQTSIVPIINNDQTAVMTNDGTTKRIAVSQTTTEPGDTIVYTLFAQNFSTTDQTSSPVKIDLSDALEYATVVDMYGGQLNGTVVSWPAATIKVGSTLTHQVAVRIKDPVPKGSDHLLSVAYGTTVTTRAPVPFNLGSLVAQPVTVGSIVAAASIVILAAYLYARSRLIVNESVIVLQQTKAGKI
jgi:uncharacterized repeat protein (TIGR01451 family)